MSALSFDYSKESTLVKKTLRDRIEREITNRVGSDSGLVVTTDEGYNGRVQVKIVSELFNGLTTSQKLEIVWGYLKEGLEPEHLQAISIVLVYGTDEL